MKAGNANQNTKRGTTPRRGFLKSASIGAGLLILPRCKVSGPDAPSNKLNILLVGAHGRSVLHYPRLKRENVVALVDVNDKNMALAKQEFPNAATYQDWRIAIDRKDIDAVVCCTPDHHHAFVANWAMNRNLHVYCEKPLAITVEEARVCRAKYLSKRNKIAVQHGTQRHALVNFNRVKELIRDGAIGEVAEVHAWTRNRFPRDGYLPAAGEPPAWINYDLWLGPAHWHPYNPEYFSGLPGTNCVHWNMHWDFGSGQIGDTGSHVMDFAWYALDATLPNRVESTSPEAFNPEVTPVEMMCRFELPGNDWRGPIGVFWHQGGSSPNSPREYVDLGKIANGAMFKGKRGILISDLASRLIIPVGDDDDMSYYRPRSKAGALKPVGDFQDNWINAAKGDLQTACDFSYAGKMVETMLLGLVAFRAGKSIDYYGDGGNIVNDAAATQFLRKEYREGWTLEG